MTKIFITGTSGSGKSSIAAELQKRDVPVLDIENRIYELSTWQNTVTKENVGRCPVKSEKFLEEHEWVCDTKKLEQLLKNYDDVVVAGVYSNQKEFLHFFDKVFLLLCNEETILHRLSTRTTNNFGKADFERDAIIKSYRQFEKEILELGAIAVVNDGDIDKTVNLITTHLSS